MQLLFYLAVCARFFLSIGTTSWKTGGVRSTGHLSIGSNGHKSLKISGALTDSSFLSNGGVVGGTVDLHNLWAFSELLH